MMNGSGLQRNEGEECSIYVEGEWHVSEQNVGVH